MRQSLTNPHPQFCYHLLCSGRKHFRRLRCQDIDCQATSKYPQSHDMNWISALFLRQGGSYGHSRRFTSATLLLALLLSACSSEPFGTEEPEPLPPTQPAPPSSEEDLLHWAAPAYTEVFHVPFLDRQQKYVLDDTKDYRIVLPDVPLTHRLDIWGGRNVVIIGGAFKLKGYSDLDNNKAALVFWHSDKYRPDTRIIHVEGVHFDMADARDRDALALNDQTAIFQVQNVRFENVNGDHDGLHPDAIENWGGAKELRIYKSTVITDHQGFFLSPIQPSHDRPMERIDLRKVDFRRNEGEYGRYPNHKCPIYLWLVNYHPGSCVTYERGAILEEIYAVHPQNCWDFGMNTAVPNTIQPEGCLASVSADSTEMYWPTLPIEGSIRQGTPIDGEFVPAGVAGVDYVSPGYQRHGR